MGPIHASELSAPIKGALWMVATCACYAALSAIVRHLSATVHPFEIAFFRTVVLLILMLPVLRARGGVRIDFAALRTHRIGLHLVRAVGGTVAMLCLFTAFSLMPIADVTALTFTAPLFATAGAALFLGETVRARRWSATGIGFVGAMIILRPGVEVLTPAAMLALGAALAMSMVVLSIKSLSRTETANSIILLNAVLMTPMTLLPALWVWTWPDPTAWGWLGAAGVVAFGVQQCLTRAFAATEASVVLPFDFARLIFTALLGLAVFGEHPDAYTLGGGAVILVTTVYIARREVLAAKAEGTTPSGGGAPIA